MVTINAKVIYRFAISVSDYILCIAWVITEKVISLTVQTNINLHMFCDEIVVKKRVFDELWAFVFFPLENS